MQVLSTKYSTLGNGGIFTIYGRDEVGVSHTINVRNCPFVFYVQINCQQHELMTYLMSMEYRFNGSIVSVRTVRRKNFYGYTGNDGSDDIGYINMFEIAVTTNGAIMQIKNHLLTEGFQVLDTNAVDANEIKFFNASIDPMVLFTNKIKLDSWVSIDMSNANRSYTNYTLVEMDDVQAIENYDMCAHTILSFDIECISLTDKFPEPENDPIIMIGCCVCRRNKNDDGIQSLENVVFMLNSAEKTTDHVAMCFDTEVQLLTEWSAYVNNIDPDFITGYNVTGFDFNYIYKRMTKLKINEAKKLGRDGSFMTIRESNTGSVQTGYRQSFTIECVGRTIIDMYPFITKNYKFRSNKLSAVSKELLSDVADVTNNEKIELPYNEFKEMFNGTDAQRTVLAEYCIQDARLPIYLERKISAIMNVTMLARVCRVPIQYILERGQQIRSFSLIYGQLMGTVYVFPEKCIQCSDEGFKGATVIEPKSQYYNSPIVTLDYASLYPSIMIANNLCYTTLLTDQSLFDSVEHNITPIDFRFVTKNVKLGVLPTILIKLLNARKEMRQIIKEGRGTDVHHNLQLAFKTCANSLYGFTGATRYGKLTCLEISSSVTAYGREMLEKTKNYINGNYPDATIVYGDTDSVMINFKSPSISSAVETGRIAAAEISKIFPSPIKMEFEKVYCPYLLVAKKRYIGKMYSDTGKFIKIEYKGVEVARRDNCKLVGTVIKTLINSLFTEEDQGGPISDAQQVPTCSKYLSSQSNNSYGYDYLSDVLQRLESRTLDINDLIISVGYTKDNYVAKNPQSCIAERIKREGVLTEIKVGDRINYIIAEHSNKKLKISERAVTLDEYNSRNLKYDISYYKNNQLLNPLKRIFGAMEQFRLAELFPSEVEQRKIARAEASAIKKAETEQKKLQRETDRNEAKQKKKVVAAANINAPKKKRVYKSKKTINEDATAVSNIIVNPDASGSSIAAPKKKRVSKSKKTIEDATTAGNTEATTTKKKRVSKSKKTIEDTTTVGNTEATTKRKRAPKKEELIATISMPPIPNDNDDAQMESTTPQETIVLGTISIPIKKPMKRKHSVQTKKDSMEIDIASHPIFNENENGNEVEIPAEPIITTISDDEDDAPIERKKRARIIVESSSSSSSSSDSESGSESGTSRICTSDEEEVAKKRVYKKIKPVDQSLYDTDDDDE